jgi:hypothetical protein
MRILTLIFSSILATSDASSKWSKEKTAEEKARQRRMLQALRAARKSVGDHPMPDKKEKRRELRDFARREKTNYKGGDSLFDPDMDFSEGEN